MKPVLPFIFDRNILDELVEKNDRRVGFVHKSLDEIQRVLTKGESSMDVRYGFSLDVYRQLIQEYTIEQVFTNRDYEPYARERDRHSKAIRKRNKVN